MTSSGGESTAPEVVDARLKDAGCNALTREYRKIGTKVQDYMQIHYDDIAILMELASG